MQKLNEKIAGQLMVAIEQICRQHDFEGVNGHWYVDEDELLDEVNTYLCKEFGIDELQR